MEDSKNAVGKRLRQGSDMSQIYSAVCCPASASAFLIQDEVVIMKQHGCDIASFCFAMSQLNCLRSFSFADTAAPASCVQSWLQGTKGIKTMERDHMTGNVASVRRACKGITSPCTRRVASAANFSASQPIQAFTPWTTFRAASCSAWRPLKVSSYTAYPTAYPT